MLRCLQATEALRRAKFKFPGRQKIVESRNWGFTSFGREDYVQWKQEGRIVNCGVHAKVRPRPSPRLPTSCGAAWVCSERSGG